jgi:hypothetical protein
MSLEGPNARNVAHFLSGLLELDVEAVVAGPATSFFSKEAVSGAGLRDLCLALGAAPGTARDIQIDGGKLTRAPINAN